MLMPALEKCNVTLERQDLARDAEKAHHHAKRDPRFVHTNGVKHLAGKHPGDRIAHLESIGSDPAAGATALNSVDRICGGIREPGYVRPCQACGRGPCLTEPVGTREPAQLGGVHQVGGDERDVRRAEAGGDGMRPIDRKRTVVEAGAIPTPPGEVVVAGSCALGAERHRAAACEAGRAGARTIRCRRGPT
jgi:hypothetical protein